MTEHSQRPPPNTVHGDSRVPYSPSFQELRKTQRLPCRLAAHAVQDGFEVPCTIIDISLGGAQLLFDSLSTRSVHDKPMVLDIPTIGKLPAEFRWRAGERGGVQFKQSAQNAALLRKKLAELGLDDGLNLPPIT